MDLGTLRHSCAHVMACAVKELWPQVKLGIGPSIEDGFYYDFDKQEPFTEEDLGRIEEKMREIIQQNQAFVREELSRDQALALFTKFKEDYKLELIREILDIMVKPKSLITFVADRPGHDRRYALDTGKINHKLGWQPKYQLEDIVKHAWAWELDRFY